MMKKSFAPFMAVGLLTGALTASAQLVQFGAVDGNAAHVTANKAFSSAPTYWTGAVSDPASGYTGPQFSFAGVGANSSALSLTQVQNNTNPGDKMQLQANSVDFESMLAFDISSPAVVGKVAMDFTRWAQNNSQIQGTDVYLILHEEGQGVGSGWYAAELVSLGNSGNAGNVDVSVSELSWSVFTPTTASGSNQLGTFGASVTASTILSKNMDKAGYFVQQEQPNVAGKKHNMFTYHFAVFEQSAELLLNPQAEVVLEFTDAIAAVSNSIAVSYNEGGVPTNINVSSVSMINSDAGFAVSPGSLLLTDPDPSAQNVTVSFDNTVGLLTANQVANGTVQFIWNEEGSAQVSTSTVPVSATYRAFADDQIIALYEHAGIAEGGAGDVVFPGVNAVMTGLGWVNTSAGSTDGSYGSLNANANDGKRCASVAETTDCLISITNNTGYDLTLDSLNFDAAKSYSGSSSNLTVSLSGDLGSAALTNIVGLTQVLYGDFDDFGVDLTTLGDNILAPGESVTFTFDFHDSVSAGASALDNVLVLGSGVIPATLQVNPAVVAFEIDADNQSVDADVAVSYLEGNREASVNVSSVTIVDDASVGGFSVLPGSFTLINPSTTQLVDVAYDNASASSPIATDEVASASVRLIWNEVGSSVITTSSIPVSATYYGITAENLLAVWHNHFDQGGRAPEISFTGVDAFMHDFTGWRQSNGGSTDGSYGTVVSTNALTTAGNAAMNAPGSVLVTLTNNTGNILDLDSINFDVNALWGGPEEFSLSMAGALGESNLLVNAAAPVLPLLSDWADYTIELNGSLLDGEHVEFTFSWGGTTGSLGLDNFALIGEGFAPATLGRVPGGPNHPWVSMGVSGLDTHASQSIDLMYGAGDLGTNVMITGVSVSNVTHAGALGVSGFSPVLLPTPDVTNSSVFTLVFDNTAANLAAGEWAEAVVSVEWFEGASGPRYYEFLAYGDRPDASPSNTIVALWHTEFYTPDAAYNGVLGGFSDGTGIQPHNDSNGQRFGSKNGTYGTRVVTPEAPTDDYTAWRFQMSEPTTSLTITNRSTAAIELTELAFDIGRWYVSASNFTLSVSGDVTDVPTFFTGELFQMGWEESIKDYDEYDVNLTTLPDHTLEAGESVTFTFSIDTSVLADSSMWVGIYLDNIALFGTADAFGGWANVWGLDGSNNGMTDNPDGDGKDNLMEYATGGDPMVADGSAADVWAGLEGGSNWMYHVHAERLDDDSLSYDVGVKSNLVYDASWSAGGVEKVGETSGPGTFKTVTNRTYMGVGAKFIGLEVNQD